MCLCRNSCLPKGLTNWTLIYNPPLETELEGDSSCLQLPVFQEAKSLCLWICPQRGGAWLGEQPPVLENCLFWHCLSGICCHSQEMEYWMVEGMSMFLFQCRWTGFTWAGVSSATCWGSTHGFHVAAPKPDPLGAVGRVCHWCSEELYICASLCPLLWVCKGQTVPALCPGLQTVLPWVSH